MSRYRAAAGHLGPAPRSNGGCSGGQRPCRNGLVARSCLAAGCWRRQPVFDRAAHRPCPAQRVLKFIPQSDLAILDPIFTAAYVTRHHGMMVFDTLYGMDAAYRIQPQMAEGHRVEDDGKTWLITLRDGLLWHDGEQVLARDCVASIRRWGARDSFGQTLMAVTDELTRPTTAPSGFA